jgi:hypothetical protein
MVVGFTCDKVCQWLVTGRWFSPVSSTNQTDSQYNWNIVESGAKHHNPNLTYAISAWHHFKLSVWCTAVERRTWHNFGSGFLHQYIVEITLQ